MPHQLCFNPVTMLGYLQITILHAVKGLATGHTLKLICMAMIEAQFKKKSHISMKKIALHLFVQAA